MGQQMHGSLLDWNRYLGLFLYSSIRAEKYSMPGRNLVGWLNAIFFQVSAKLV